MPTSYENYLLRDQYGPGLGSTTLPPPDLYQPFPWPDQGSVAPIPTYDPGVGGNAPYVGPIQEAPTEPSTPGPGVGPGPAVESGWDSASTWLGAMTNPFYRVTRRVRATKLTKFLEAEAKVGLRAIGTWWQTGSTATLGEDIAARGIGGAGFPWSRAIAGGTLAGFALSMLFPEKTSTTDVFPLPLKNLADKSFAAQVKQMVFEQKQREQLRQPSEAVRALMYRGPDVVLGERPRTLVEKLEQLYQEPFSIGRLLNPSGWTPFRVGGTVVTASAPGFSDYPHEMVTEVYGPPRPTPPVPAGVATPSSSGVPQVQLPAPRTGINRIRLGLGIGLLGLELGRSLGHQGGRSGPGGSPIAPGATIPVVPGTQPSPQTGVQALVGGFGSMSYGGGYCTPRPRGPRRKCLERAPVSWRAGRNKGKAAGSKCVRYAQRAS